MKEAILAADAVYVSPISIYEVVRKVAIGKWPEIVPNLGTLALLGRATDRIGSLHACRGRPGRGARLGAQGSVRPAHRRHRDRDGLGTDFQGP